MTADNNKGIGGIIYNHLNLPIKINFGAKGEITYLYNATGQKLQKFVKDIVSNTNNTTDYLSGFQYKNTELQFFPHAEGYVHYTKPLAAQGGENSALGSFNYVFNYTDHLGNVRLSYARDPLVRNRVKILEENHYYAFGLKHKNYNVEHLDFDQFPDTGVELVPMPAVANASYNYKYNGKELQEELGLNFYDYGARNYDPALGRWMNIDPKAEQSRRWSPYNYAYNNPMVFVDPDGMQADDWVSVLIGKNTYQAQWKSNVTGPNDKDIGANNKYIGKSGQVSCDDGKTYNLGSDGYASIAEPSVAKTSTEEVSVETANSSNETGSSTGNVSRAESLMDAVGGMGDALSEGSTYVKGGGIALAVIGALTANPVLIGAGIEAYNFGSAMDNLGTVMSGANDVADGNYDKVAIKAVSLGAGKLIDGTVNKLVPVSSGPVGNATFKYANDWYSGHVKDDALKATDRR